MDMSVWIGDNAEFIVSKFFDIVNECAGVAASSVPSVPSRAAFNWSIYG